jgi:hypothetical protein
MTAMEDPRRAMPYTDKDEPRRHIDLIASELPKFTKSNTDSDEPRCATP